ncbi:NAD(P) transhydrogenase subunit alpha [Alloscardovia theropitheci]|uniref:proton-translocating NAD(P)(+) transhydrogenase n=1 Tax=Alloscardovia theropitheci TaxID=2496842 RepID=A0A4R0QZ91_9BIFI|nr:NAD(P) transhydrogenase subunit alpha [Alloscardovia theropitheci]TCD55091.1 NAD(P) transhydrogenase subunit alpha [Alloscardovia theropitheci]
MSDKDVTVIYGVLNERTEHEKRAALTPDIVSRLTKSGIQCLMESGAGLDAHFLDSDYEKAGARIASRDEIITIADVLAFISRPTSEVVSSLRAGTWIVGAMNSFTDEGYINILKTSGVTAVAMERLPRQLSSAQSMDEMTSQNSITGYKAVLKAADAYTSILPMMTTAAGTIRPAKVLVLGAGIAGLQAIGTAKRFGAVVTGYDVRPAAQSEVESLGAKFLDLNIDLGKDQGDGGYARELSDEEKVLQQAAVDQKASEFDIIITTAQVPGRKPPVLLTAKGIACLKRGAVVVDCAASEFGGNVEGSKPREVIRTDNGVTILGLPDLASDVSTTASQQISRNLADTVLHFMREKDGQIKLTVDFDDEIDKAMIVAYSQENVNENKE